MIDELVDDLKRDEGYVPYAYQDHLGYWTIGYGFLVDKDKGGQIPKSIAESWLMLAINDRWNALVSRKPEVLDYPEDVQRALGNMAYQLGVNGLLRFKKMFAALDAGDRVLAAQEAWDSTWAKQTPERARRVTRLIRG